MFKKTTTLIFGLMLGFMFAGAGDAYEAPYEECIKYNKVEGTDPIVCFTDDLKTLVWLVEQGELGADELYGVLANLNKQIAIAAFTDDCELERIVNTVPGWADSVKRYAYDFSLIDGGDPNVEFINVYEAMLALAEEMRVATRDCAVND